MGERPSEASSAMCILSLLLGRLSRFISMMSPLRSWGVMVIFSMCGRFFGGWMDVASLPCHKGRPFVLFILCIYLALDKLLTTDRRGIDSLRRELSASCFWLMAES